MASVVVQQFSVRLLTGRRIRIDVRFGVTPTRTEARLGIPSHVWIRLVARDGTAVGPHIPVDGRDNRLFIDEDDPSTGWMYAGVFTGGYTVFSRVLYRDEWPDGTGGDRWSVQAAARPDFSSSLFHSLEIPAQLG